MAANTTIIPAYSTMSMTDIMQTLPATLITLTGMIKVTQTLTKSKAHQFADFPHWQYFVGEFTQYFDKESRVSLISCVCLFIIDFSLPLLPQYSATKQQYLSKENS